MPAFYQELTYKALLALTKRIVMVPQPRPALFCGPNASQHLGANIAHLGLSHVLLVTDKPLLKLGVAESTLAALRQRGIETSIFDGVLPDPTLQVVDDGVRYLQQQGCDAVLALGGGSSIDAAKVIALAAANGLSARQCVGWKKAKSSALPLFAIPSTAGTGSEVSMAALVSDNDTHQKLIVADTRIIPLAAALDPIIMAGMPPAVTAATGMDALTHAIESYINSWSTAESRRYGRAATKLIFDNLPRAYADGDDLDAREAMALASYYAGLACSSSLVGYAHALSHQLGAYYRIPHGLGNALTLPPVLETLKDAAAAPLAELAVYADLGEACESHATLAQKLIDRVWALNAEIGISKTTDAIKPRDIDAIVKAALKEGSGYPVPRYLERSECEQLVRGLSQN